MKRKNPYSFLVPEDAAISKHIGMLGTDFSNYSSKVRISEQLVKNAPSNNVCCKSNSAIFLAFWINRRNKNVGEEV